MTYNIYYYKSYYFRQQLTVYLNAVEVGWFEEQHK